VKRARWWRGVGIGFALGVILVVAGALATAPTFLDNHAKSPQLSRDLDVWLAEQERDFAKRAPLIEGTEKRIRWFEDRRSSKTRYSIVYIHGFSATRQEIAPVAERVADALGANLFETRLSGHGLQSHPLVNVRAEDWLDDAAEALAIGGELGQNIIVMGTSTGATLALAMIQHPTFQKVSHLVLISPNFAPRDSSAEVLTWPGGPQLAYMVSGDTRSWTPNNPLQGRYWTTSYPMDALVEMMRLVKYVRTLLPMNLTQSLLVLYSPHDSVVDTQWITSAFEQIHSPRQQLLPINESGDPSNHVIAGNILSPRNNQPVADAIVQFVQDGLD